MTGGQSTAVGEATDDVLNKARAVFCLQTAPPLEGAEEDRGRSAAAGGGGGGFVQLAPRRVLRAYCHLPLEACV